MYIYLTSGTPEFMESLCAKYAKENMIAMHGSTNSVLLHETEGKSFFSTPRKFEVIDSLGQFENSGFFVFNNIPIIDEGRPVFEHRVLNRSSNIDKEPGFIAFRLLRPIKAETYIVITQWKGPHSYEAWKMSKAYKEYQSTFENQVGIKQENIFSTAAYTSTYTALAPEEE